MMALSWGETTIVVDAGVMFPDPELLGVDRIIPDLTYLQQKGRAAALVLTHGHEDHIGAVPHVLPYIDGPVYGTPLTLALVEPKLAEHGIQGRTSRSRPAARSRDGRTVLDRIHPRHAQHPGLRRAGDSHPGRRRRPHRRLQDRSDADRRPALRRPPLRGARQRPACSRCLPTARTSIAAASPDRSAKSSKRSRRSSRARPDAWSWPPSRRASTGCRSWSTWPRSSIARWRSSAAA